MLVGAAAIGVDYGVAVQTKRKAQGAADVAAMVAAIDIANATAIARRSLADNGYAATQSTVTTGTYDSTASLGARFSEGVGTGGNAVKVKLTANAPDDLRPSPRPAGVRCGGRDGDGGGDGAVRGLSPSARASSPSTAAVANLVLGALLGAKLSLGAVDYNALLTTRVDGLRVLDALGASLGLQAASYTRDPPGQCQHRGRC